MVGRSSERNCGGGTGGAEDGVTDKRKGVPGLNFEQGTLFCFAYNYPIWIYMYVVYPIFTLNTCKAGFPICGQPLPGTVQAGSRFQV